MLKKSGGRKAVERSQHLTNERLIRGAPGTVKMPEESLAYTESAMQKFRPTNSSDSSKCCYVSNDRWLGGPNKWLPLAAAENHLGKGTAACISSGNFGILLSLLLFSTNGHGKLRVRGGAR